MYKGIIMSNGTPLLELEQCTKPVKIGYQIIHQTTGRTLPMTNRNEIYTAWAAAEKLGDVALRIPTLDAMDYIMKSIYDYEKPDHCTFIKSKFD